MAPHHRPPRRRHRPPRETVQSGSRKRLSCGTVEKTPCLNINELYRGGAFKPGINAFPAIGLRHPELQYLRAGQSGIELTYRCGIVQVIAIAWSGCRIRGYQPFFLCQCGKRVGRLYFTGLGVACRACAGLRYACQQKNGTYRANLIAAKLRLKLGGQPSTALPFPQKPPRMWRRTFYRLRNRAQRLEGRLPQHSRAKRRMQDYSLLMQR
jgi:hypothetical protein